MSPQMDQFRTFSGKVNTLVGKVNTRVGLWRLLGYCLAVVILWQYIGILADGWNISVYRPTDLIDTATSLSRAFFNWVGGLWAHLCSFWEQIDFKDLITTLYQLGRSLLSLLSSWHHLSLEYWRVRNWFEADAYLVDLGAITIILTLLGTICFRYSRQVGQTLSRYGVWLTL